MSTDKQIPNIDRYLAYCKHSKIPAKGTVYNPEDTTESIFYIVKGTVVLMMEDRSGKEMIIDYLSDGSFFGSLGIYDEGASSRGERVVARVDCELGEMQYDRFLELVRIYPSLMRELDAQIVARLRASTQKILDLASLDAPGRVARCLLDLCELPQAKRVEGGIQIKVSRQEISKIVGCTRESAGRILQDMNDAGTLSSKGMTTIVYDKLKQ